MGKSNNGLAGNLSKILDAIKRSERKSLSAQQLSEVIEQLGKEKTAAEDRERKAKEVKKAEAERKAREKAEREAQLQQLTTMELPLDWENAFSGDVRTQGIHTDSIPDALILSLSNLGRVDIEYISAITGADYKTVICTLQGAIYQNPQTWEECFYKGWETAEEYLSGNLVRKYREAQKANRQFCGYFAKNLAALQKRMPPAVTAEDIYITLGSPWVPADVIDDFIVHLFGASTCYGNTMKEAFATRHDVITGTWEIPYKDRYWHGNVKISATYGTEKLTALYLLERTLNMKSASVTKSVPAPQNASGQKRVVDREQTLLALEKQKNLIEAFQKWVWTDPARKDRLLEIFDTNFGCICKRSFDGSFLTFPTMSPRVSLFAYQKDAVARILFSPNTLLAHDVGAGKTYVMIAAGMEAIRMGLSQKNLYVVPNNLVGQWKSIFLELYPQAKLLCIEPKNFTPAKRAAALRSIRDGQWDGVILAYSCFEQIPLSKELYRKQLLDEQAEIERLVKEKSKTTASLRKKLEKLKESLSELALAQETAFDGAYFDELGITRLFVDEAHNFKNVPIETKTSNVLGISAGGSKKCQDMLDKVRTVQRQNDGGGVVMATGTPITNSVTDAFIMQKYLQSGELALLDLQSFDSWIGMFAQQNTEFEIDVDTNSYRLATRFSKFHNLPELTGLLSGIADFHGMEGSADLPVTQGYCDTRISKTPEFSDYLSEISSRAEQVRSGGVSRKQDNMLKITTDGRKAALDIRLVRPNAVNTFQSKVMRCAENVADIYRKTAQARSTQLVFCDTSTPKAGFNIYDELKMRLLTMGVEEGEIAYIHDVNTEAQRTRLFAKMRAGEIRVLIGSTFKLGLGVNVQDKLIALHHLDVPWRPADMTQREGRILRQGNENRQVQIFRYITEGSFDAYSWQLLETKQRFICDLLSGSVSQRSGADIENTVLSYAEVKALAVGHPLVKERVEVANELNRYQTLQRKLVEQRIAWEQELQSLPRQLENQQRLIDACGEDIAALAKEVLPDKRDPEVAEQRRLLRSQLHEAVQNNILETRERVFAQYRGFSLCLPAGMTADRPYLYLQRTGRYYLELGDREVGYFIRIDNFLKDLSQHQAFLQEGLGKLQGRQQDIRDKLTEKDGYIDQIAECKDRLQRIDKLLGVDKQ